MTYRLLTILGIDVSFTSHFFSFKSSPPDQTVLRSQVSHVTHHGSKSCACHFVVTSYAPPEPGDRIAREPEDNDVMMFGRVELLSAIPRGAHGERR